LLVGLNLLCGDLNDDNRVDVLDYDLWRAAVGSCSANAHYNRRADLDESGCVDHADYALWNACSTARRSNSPSAY
jgi:hypothetical protein